MMDDAQRSVILSEAKDLRNHQRETPRLDAAASPKILRFAQDDTPSIIHRLSSCRLFHRNANTPRPPHPFHGESARAQAGDYRVDVLLVHRGADDAGIEPLVGR